MSASVFHDAIPTPMASRASMSQAHDSTPHIGHGRDEHGLRTMAYEIERIHSEQGLIVRELFVDTADDNYIAARWCFVEGLNIDWFWLAVHALEKYMKAALLLNGLSAKDYRDAAGKTRAYGHDIAALHEQVRSFASDLLPNELAKPEQLALDHWSNETPEAFLHRFYSNGNADNRYQIFGFVQHSEDLFKLDSMVFALRRLCVPLDGYFLAKRRPGKRNPTNRDILATQPEYWSVSSGCKLEKTARGRRGERLREVLLKFNFPFAPDDFPHGTTTLGTAWHNPVLARSILKPLESAPDSRAATTAAELCGWVLENIKLPPVVAGQLRQAMPKRAP